MSQPIYSHNQHRYSLVVNPTGELTGYAILAGGILPTGFYTVPSRVGTEIEVKPVGFFNDSVSRPDMESFNREELG